MHSIREIFVQLSQFFNQWLKIRYNGYVTESILEHRRRGTKHHGQRKSHILRFINLHQL